MILATPFFAGLKPMIFSFRIGHPKVPEYHRKVCQGGMDCWKMLRGPQGPPITSWHTHVNFNVNSVARMAYVSTKQATMPRGLELLLQISPFSETILQPAIRPSPVPSGNFSHSYWSHGPVESSLIYPWKMDKMVDLSIVFCMFYQAGWTKHHWKIHRIPTGDFPTEPGSDAARKPCPAPRNVPGTARQTSGDICAK